jgi:hypothetical protein
MRVSFYFEIYGVICFSAALWSGRRWYAPASFVGAQQVNIAAQCFASTSVY